MNGTINLLFEIGAPFPYGEGRFNRGHHTSNLLRDRVKFREILVGDDSGHNTAEEMSERHRHAQREAQYRFAETCQYDDGGSYLVYRVGLRR